MQARSRYRLIAAALVPAYTGCPGKEAVKLSQDVVDATSVNQFKNRLDKFWRRYGH